MSSHQIDAVLESFLGSVDEAESQESLTRLLSEFAEPIIGNIVRNKLLTTSRPDVEDVCGSIQIQLLSRLVNLRNNLQGEAIRDFRGYVATTADNACNEYLRQKYPQRYSLKNKLRHVLTHNKNFSVWDGGDHHSICGFAACARTTPASNSKRLRELQDNPHLFVQGTAPSLMNLSDLLTLIFDWVSAPMKLDDLVSVVADFLKVKDQPVETSEVGSRFSENDFCSDASPRITIEQRECLQHLWNEINLLPPRQRAALLLNLRDTEGRELIAFLPLTRTATIRQIADAVNIPPPISLPNCGENCRSMTRRSPSASVLRDNR